LHDCETRPDELSDYAVLRASQLMQPKDPANSLEILRVSMQKAPSVALAYAIAKVQADKGVDFDWKIEGMPGLDTLDDGLIWEISQFLAKNGKREASQKLLRILLLRPECQEDPELKKALGI
jgi:hypothetical protein